MAGSEHISRRRFLGRSAAALAGLAAPAAIASGALRQSRRAQAVVIVRFGGGVRFSEMWSRSGMGNIPFLSRLAREGAFFPRMYNRGRIDHVAGTYNILTGRYEWPDSGSRPEMPTLFEYIRKEFKTSAEEAMLISHVGDVAFATFSAHADYGSRFGATRISPEMVEIQRLENQLRRRDMDRRVRRAVEGRLQHYRGREKNAHDIDPLPGQKSGPVRRFIDYLAGAALPGGFQNRGDDQATWFAMQAVEKPQPQALMLPLGSTDRALTGRWSDYIEAIKRCDWLIEKLVAAIQGSAKYRGRTLLVVVPDHGRCGDGHGSAGFQYYDGADESCKHISCVMVGPGVRKGRIVDRPCEQIDILPTIAELMGFAAPHAKGKVLKEALA